MTNILISGVGGQGTLLTSRILGNLLIARGMDVKVSEVHGMSQRGGSVVTYVRAGGSGQSVASPLVTEAEADLLLAFEQMEAVRWSPYVRKGGTIAVNIQKIPPMPVISGKAQYPGDLLDKLDALNAEVIALDALELANRAGNAKAVNVVMLGAVSAKMNYSVQEWDAALKATIPAKLLDVNLKAFQLGRQVEGK